MGVSGSFPVAGPKFITSNIEALRVLSDRASVCVYILVYFLQIKYDSTLMSVTPYSTTVMFLHSVTQILIQYKPTNCAFSKLIF